MGILKKPIVTEKVSAGNESGKYGFIVEKTANKVEIKKAVEGIYGVSVRNVTVLNVKGKVKRTMRGTSRKASWKKAYVRLNDGHDIDFSTTPS